MTCGMNKNGKGCGCEMDKLGQKIGKVPVIFKELEKTDQIGRASCRERV